MDKSGFLKRFYLIVGVGACVLLALAWSFVEGGLSPRAFAVAGLIWWVAMFSAIFSLIRWRQRASKEIRQQQIASGVSAAKLDRELCEKNIRSMKRLLAIFALLLCYGLLSTQGEPWLPRGVGAAFDLFLLGACVYSLLQSKRKLKAIDSALAKSASDSN